LKGLIPQGVFYAYLLEFIHFIELRFLKNVDDNQDCRSYQTLSNRFFVPPLMDALKPRAR